MIINLCEHGTCTVSADLTLRGIVFGRARQDKGYIVKFALDHITYHGMPHPLVDHDILFLEIPIW